MVYNQIVLSYMQESLCSDSFAFSVRSHGFREFSLRCMEEDFQSSDPTVTLSSKPCASCDGRLPRNLLRF